MRVRYGGKLRAIDITHFLFELMLPKAGFYFLLIVKLLWAKGCENLERKGNKRSLNSLETCLVHMPIFILHSAYLKIFACAEREKSSRIRVGVSSLFGVKAFARVEEPVLRYC